MKTTSFLTPNPRGIFKKLFGTVSLALLLTASGLQVAAQTTLFYKGAGALNDVSSWGINSDGSGGNAGITDFTGNSFSYVIQNTAAIVFNSGTWTVSGTGTKVFMGNPTTPSPAISLTVAAGATINTAGQLFDVPAPSAGVHKIIYQNATPISVGTVDPNLELVFDGAVFATATSRVYGDASLINGARIDFSGASNGPTFNNLTIAEGCTLTGPVGGSSTWIGIKSSGIVTINGIFRAGRTGGLFTANVPFPVVPSTTNGTLLFNNATVTQGENLRLGSNSTIEYYRGTSNQTGAQTVQALNYANLIFSNSLVASNKLFGAGNLSVSKDFVVNMRAGATITAPTTQNITLLPGAKLLINSATAFPTPTGAGRLVLQSDATGTAAIGSLAAGASMVGNVTVQQYIPPGFRKYRFLSHPFTMAQPLSQLTGEIDITGNTAGTTGNPGQMVGPGFTATTTNNPSAYTFSTANANGNATNDAGWSAIVDATTNTWGVGQGIRVLTRGPKGQPGTLDGMEAVPQAATLEMTGIVNTGNVSIPLQIGGTGSTADYNLVGNPYPSPVDIGAVLTAAGAGVGNSFFLRNPQTGAYITVSPIPSNYMIPAHAAFLVKANAAGNLNFLETNKTNCAGCPTVFRVRNDTAILGLQVLSNGLEYDRLIVAMDKSFNNRLDKLDAEKLMNEGLSLYALSADQQKLAATYVNADVKEIPLGIVLPKQYGKQTFTISVSNYSIAKQTQMLLFDRLNQSYTLLEKGVSHTITIDPNHASQIGENRLSIIVRKSSVANNRSN